MIELLRRSAQADHLGSVVTDDEVVRYDELLQRAESAAGYLITNGIDRVAVATYDAAHVIAALAGASLAGAEACVYPPEPPDRIEQLAARFGHECLISDRDDLGQAGRIVPVQELINARPGEGPLPPGRPHLVLTTGTTGEPRGVRHSWTRLVRRYESVTSAPGHRWLLCYGTHQFAGLQVLLHVLAIGAPLIAVTPRRPVEGLAAMRRHQANHASATPTYWRHVLLELAGDGGPVPPLQQITLGGEAADAALLARLQEVFPTAAVSHVYAASEFGSTSSIRDGVNGLPVDALRAHASGTELKVVDGELWVRSREGMLGYWGEPDIDPDAWRATGDLVRVENGRVVFEGRKSDIVNVGGVKVSPLTVEQAVSRAPSVAAVRAYGRRNALTGSIVAVDVVPVPGVSVEQVQDDVRRACEALDRAARPRSIHVVDEVATRGGKVVRTHE